MGLPRATSGVIAIIMLAACTTVTPAHESAWRSASGEGGMAGELVGVLVKEGACLYVDAETGRWLPIFDGQPSWTDDGKLRLGADVYSIGSEISLAGGEAIPNSTEVNVPEACDASQAWWLVNTPE